MLARRSPTLSPSDLGFECRADLKRVSLTAKRAGAPIRDGYGFTGSIYPIRIRSWEYTATDYVSTFRALTGRYLALIARQSPTGPLTSSGTLYYNLALDVTQEPDRGANTISNAITSLTRL